MKSICYVFPYLVMPEVSHLVELAEKSSNNGFQVTILSLNQSVNSEIVNSCKKRGFLCEFIKDHDAEERVNIRYAPFLESYSVWKWLQSKQFDIVRFADIRGLGFHAIQAKRTTANFLETLFLVDMYGPSQWRLEEHSDWGYGGFEQLMIQYMERYTCQYCDGLSEAVSGIFQWATDRRWELCPKRFDRKLNVFIDFQGNSDFTPPDQPLVSVCIAYYNHGDYIQNALVSLVNNTYKNIEVIVVNDGSTDQKSVEVFDRLKDLYHGNNFKFFNKNNEGPSIARNFAVSEAIGEYLVFMDADNIAKPDMIECFVNSAGRGFDCLSCYFDQFFGKGKPPEAVTNKNPLYALLGPSLETGLFLNCFGDTNFIIRRDVFLKLGGFSPQRIVTEDWQFLAKLVLAGYKHDVIPYSLFWYRVTSSSNVNYGNEYSKQRFIIETFCKELPPYVYHVFVSLCRPTLGTKENPALNQVFRFMNNSVNKIFPHNSRRRHLAKGLVGIFVKSYNSQSIKQEQMTER